MSSPNDPIPVLYNKIHAVVKKNPWGRPRGKGGYYEKLMEVIFSVMVRVKN
jgi:hypothetical protein